MEIPSASTTSSTLEQLEIAERLGRLIRRFGLSVSAAASAAGVPRVTLARWRQTNPAVALRLERAREEFRQSQLLILMEGRKNWRAASWLLERVFPADYHPRATERARFRADEAESAESAAKPPVSSEIMLQNSPGTSPAPARGECRTDSEALLQNPAPAPVERLAPIAPIAASASETVLQNSDAPRALSRQARRAVERNRQRAERLATASVVA